VQEEGIDVNDEAKLFGKLSKKQRDIVSRAEGFLRELKKYKPDEIVEDIDFLILRAGIIEEECSDFIRKVEEVRQGETDRTNKMVLVQMVASVETEKNVANALKESLTALAYAMKQSGKVKDITKLRFFLDELERYG
jgi:hypothetical protein